MNKTIILLAIIGMLMMGAAIADIDEFDPAGEDIGAKPGMDKITDMIKSTIGIVQYVAAGLAVLFAMITGVQFMNARDPHEKRQLGDRLKYIVTGIVIVTLSIPIVRLFL